MIIKYIFFLIIGFNSNVFAKNHYKIEEIKDSKYIGKVYYIEKPIVYIKKLSNCNDLEKYTALNTSCLFVKKAEFKIEKISNSCPSCLSKKYMPVPLRVELKEKTKLTVVGVYSSSINYLSYKIFGGSETYKHFLFIDQDGNYIEMPFYDVDSQYGVMSNEISRESNKIMAIKQPSEMITPINRESNKITESKQQPYIVKQICYYEKSHDDFETSKNKVIKMISDFELSDSIKVSDSVCNRRGMRKKGVVVATKNFNDFLTFYYFKSGWGIYGKMY